MTEEQAKALYPLILAVRQLFHKLAAAADALHHDSGITAGMRAVLESLVSQGPQTVPQMAKARPVSRQHIQGLVNALAAEGLVETQENPAHRRSHLIAASAAGLAAFKSIKEREAAAFVALSLAAEPEEIAAASSLLSSFASSIDAYHWHSQSATNKE